MGFEDSSWDISVPSLHQVLRYPAENRQKTGKNPTPATAMGMDNHCLTKQ